MNQNFSHKQIIKFSNEYELTESGLSKEELIEQIDNNFNNIIDETFEFEIEKKGKYFLTENLSHKLIIRKLNDNLKRVYKEKQSNRRIIISQIKSLLRDDVPMWILKTDIKSFYESINVNEITTKLKEDAILSYHSMKLIGQLFTYFSTQGINGLPRGISLSATISEIYMRKFDWWIKSQKEIFYYARFVDDIIIFCTKKEDIEILNSQINKKLPKGLVKKNTKTHLYNGNQITTDNPLQFLGYKFIASKPSRNKKVLKVSIADKKVKKIKTKIIQAILSNWKKSDFELLVKRIKFLSGNYSIRSGKNRNDLKAGIYYNYSQINDLECLDQINLFYRKALKTNSGPWKTKIDQSLSIFQINHLLKYSFKSGFTDRIYTNFKKEEMVEITNCWR